MLDLAAGFVSLTALLAFVNRRFVGLPPTIGVMAIALVCSLLLHGLTLLGLPGLEQRIQTAMARVDFDRLLLDCRLSFLLFAGAINLDFGGIRKRAWAIGLLATAGVAISILGIGLTTWWLLKQLDLDVSLVWCLVFGAIVAPTDPVAVLGILKSAGAPKSLETTIVGESLFNDGMAVVAFTLLVGTLGSEAPPALGETLWLLFEEIGGGLLLGALLGALAYRLMNSIDDYQVEVLLTVALVLGGYTWSTHLEVSGPIAMTVAGLIVGNLVRERALSDRTRKHLDSFWTLIDEFLNALLFVLMGLELVLVPFEWRYVPLAFALVAVILGVRLATVGPPLALIGFWKRELPPGAARILTWGGLRGGVSVALVLALPAGEERDLFLNLTYLVVLFSVLVQGLTIGRLVQRACRTAPPAHAERD